MFSCFQGSEKSLGILRAAPCNVVSPCQFKESGDLAQEVFICNCSQCDQRWRQPVKPRQTFFSAHPDGWSVQNTTGHTLDRVPIWLWKSNFQQQVGWATRLHTHILTHADHHHHLQQHNHRNFRADRSSPHLQFNFVTIATAIGLQRDKAGVYWRRLLRDIYGAFTPPPFSLRDPNPSSYPPPQRPFQSLTHSEGHGIA